ncbi:hypothetical protein QVD17_24436 [Tagetes erecta]|uniref:Uncharacterized protein n=1 Tax=Tagetes erecta TaxID=13708 RepID=A0AAD8NUL2_TARER|nr:hypothetical protein QVD17_24436 [Tagetes erecta]
MFFVWHLFGGLESMLHTRLVSSIGSFLLSSLKVPCVWAARDALELELLVKLLLSRAWIVICLKLVELMLD